MANDRTVTLRLPSELLVRLDRAAAELALKTHLSVPRASMIRLCIERHLERLDPIERRLERVESNARRARDQ